MKAIRYLCIALLLNVVSPIAANDESSTKAVSIMASLLLGGLTLWVTKLINEHQNLGPEWSIPTSIIGSLVSASLLFDKEYAGTFRDWAMKTPIIALMAHGAFSKPFNEVVGNIPMIGKSLEVDTVATKAIKIIACWRIVEAGIHELKKRGWCPDFNGEVKAKKQCAYCGSRLE